MDVKNNHYYTKIPQSRIATFDIYSIGLLKHHVSALLEFDVTESRRKLSELRKKGTNISFNAWLVKAISRTLEKYPEATSYQYSKKKLLTFNDHNISFLVEKQIGDQKVPLPVVIDQVNLKSALNISHEIENVKRHIVTEKDIVLDKKSKFYERLYYHLPGFLRKMIWRYILNHPRLAYRKMGNISITSLGMIGKINGWFIHKSIHPVSFGVGSIIQKPTVIGDDIKIRDVLNMTILIDHDVIDGAPMVRLLKELKKNIEMGAEIN
ncbi:MAG: 2-oxo acid dehydrogenase subunit E2 [Bacteroidales bacterium]|nr:2-oxo acid dehydrogenase subunit E2 [Bacteroidales bacterium]MCF8327882.1 2-oxo acid dehydrogenase subunit E2 [Bacteroidales bacterium]